MQLQFPRRINPTFAHGVDGFADEPPAPRRSRVMRRRVLVFSCVFLLCALLSLAYTYLRDPVYLAQARVQITPASGASVAPAPSGKDSKDILLQPGGAQSFLVEIQVFTSRPVLEKAVQRLRANGATSLDDSPEGVTALQNMLQVHPVSGTNVAQVEARGPDRFLVAALVNTVIDVYREAQASQGEASSRALLADAREEARVVDAKVAEKKKLLEDFRSRSNIVSIERDENQVLARLKAQSAALSLGTDREAVAEGKVRALEQAAAAGQAPQLSRDSPNVAAMAQRLSQWREEWRALERQFTPDYLAMDPNARALKNRITSLEQQIEVERGKGQQNALAEARDELASVRAANRRLQQQMTEDKQTVQGFTRNFSEYKTMQEELQGLEQMRQSSRQRVLSLEASENARRPRVQLVESAVPPDTAWRPLYTRDALISLAGSLALGFLAVWFVEFFNRVEPPAPGPSTVIIPQPWGPGAFAGVNAGLAGPVNPVHELLPGQANQAPLAQLPQAQPRELDPEEREQLLHAAAPDHAAVLVCLLCGLTVDEVIALRVADVDPEAGVLHVTGESARDLALPPQWLQSLGTPTSAPDAPLFSDGKGAPLQAQDVQAMVTSGAHDAALAQPESITPQALRHTYIVFLVRQGCRFSDLGRLVGRLSAEALNALGGLAPAAEKKLPMQSIARQLPEVQAFTSPAGDPGAAG
ncbi:GumC family protein [Variovorax sp. HJSM1_2]|uniref:GumC family protein n=1 Tax=Variovorax sp. HJSM1_2 TaxID=3366263 RepID=UPI003BDB5ADB